MFTARVQYALVLLRELDRYGKTGPVKLKDVSVSTGLKLEFLEQVARKLRIGGFVRSIKGPGGGYILEKHLDDLSLLDVYKCMQPDSKLKLAASTKESESYLKSLHEDYLSLVDELGIL